MKVIESGSSKRIPNGNIISHVVEKVKGQGFQNVKEHDKFCLELKVIANQRY